MNEKLADALGYVDEKFVAAAVRRKKKKKVILGAIAAVLALVMLVNAPTIPFVVTAKAVALASDSRAPQWHGSGDLRNTHDDFDAYWAVREANEVTVTEAMTDMAPFFAETSDQFLTGSDENMVWSPVNAAIALSVLAETAGGTTRQEVLDLLGVEDIGTLREYIARIWEAGYENDGNEISVLANSLWLDDRMGYDQSVMDTLAHDYYASVYQGNLGSMLTNNAIQTWVNNQTGGFLNRMSNGIDLSPSPKSIGTVMALVSTVYLHGKWYDEFDAGQNTDDIFHSPGGDRTVTYMNQKETQTYYYWGESYGAIYLGMKNGTDMWLILPDEDKTTADVLSEGEYLGMFGSQYTSEYENSKYMKVNLSLPKFDISAEMDLAEGLKALGLTEVFDENGGDFGDTFDTELPIFVDQIKQASRVSIDETGVTAASYIELMWGAGAAAPPEEIIDFVLDRPFIFAITSYEGVPLFMGVVNEP